ncbi:MAG: hypothetical protein HND50_11095 [Calditrichaeota bacterium]|nr:hypothetical protein [Calditrichota bacterium]
MEKEKIFDSLIPKDRNLDRIATEADKNPELVSYLLEGVQNKNVRIKYGCFNTLVLISEKKPELLYPHFDLFVEYLNSDNNIFKLGSIKMISNLSKVDSQKKFDKIFDKFYSFIRDPEMTPAANVSKGSIIIAKAKPHLTENITNQLLTVSQTKYKTKECKNILIGHVISSFDKMFNKLEYKDMVMQFVEKNLNNPWKGTKSKAEKFLKKRKSTA